MSAMGIRGTANALRNLWEATANTLSTEQLEWYKGLTEAARFEAQNISENMSAVSTLISGADPSSQPGDETISTILFSLANQLDNIASLIEIGSDASFRLLERAKADSTQDGQ